MNGRRAVSSESVESIGSLIENARARLASDLHLDPARGVALRIFSRIERLPAASVSVADVDAFVETTFDALSRARLESAGTAGCAYADQKTGALRIQASKARDGCRLAIRLLPAELPDLDALRLPEAFAAFGRARGGLVVLAGPSGSGKTTAIVSLLAQLCRTAALNIVTVERMVEHVLAWQRSIVSHAEVGRDVATFAEGIRGAVRSDADVVFAGELLDYETLEACFEAAEAGLLVFAASGVPPEAALALDRLVTFFPPEKRERGRRRLADALRGLVGLRLLPVRDGTGVRAAAEVLLANDGTRRIVGAGTFAQIRNHIASCSRDGMVTLESSLSQLVAEGAIDLASARSVSQHPDEVYASPLDGLRA